MAFETGTEKINKLICAQADISMKWDLRSAIRMLNDDWLDILEQSINSQFSKAARARLRPLLTTEINVLKKVVEETAQVYKRPAKRWAGKEVESEDMTEEIHDSRYDKIAEEANLDLVMATAQKYTKAVNHVLLRPVMREGRMDIDITMPDAFELYTSENDWKKIVAVMYYTGLDYTYSQFGSTDGMRIRRFQKKYLWVSEDSIINGKTYAVGVYEWNGEHADEKAYEVYDYPYIVNGKAVLPFVLTSEEWPVETLLNFTRHSELVTSTVQIGTLLVLLNELKKFASYKQPYIIGPSDLAEHFKDSKAGGPGTIWKLFSSDGSGSVGVLDSTSSVSEFMSVIEKRIIMILAQYGIPPSSFTQSGSPVSGYARKIERQALDEARQKDVVYWRKIERELFEKMRMVNNLDGGKAVLDTSEFHIDFDDQEYKPSPDEEMRRDGFDLLNNLTTPAQIMMRDNPDLDEDEALILYQKNKATNSNRLTVAPLTQPILTQPESKGA